MAALSTEVKAFIVQSLACYETPVKVIELVKAEYGIDVSRQQVSQYTPGNAMAAKLSQKWIDLFNATRKRFQNEIGDIPIANKAYRLRVLDRMATNAEKMKNYGMTSQLIEQAAKEMGDAYTNRQKVVEGKTVSETEEQLIFDGNVHDAIRGFPRNVNVSVATALATDAKDAKVRLISKPGITEVSHRITLSNDIMHSELFFVSQPDPENKKNSKSGKCGA